MTKPLLSSLKYAKGSRKKIKRIGRGQGSGHGGTATRGHKGEGARSGTHYRPWFEGGQMPLIRRIPKFGFHSPFRVEYHIVNVSTLDKLMSSGKLTDGRVSPEVLYKISTVSKKTALVKILGEGELKAKLEVSAHSFSKSAAEKIERAGGKTITLSQSSK
ncbi:MAG: 50S ribosomal protein L15 [Ignavibacteria bacterium]|nr:50S ribosomal protein L15 [Ignavibacteria bacterium]MBI3766223.1 50S ribosomal protein L15 [Ignavibacteriales bacterium]